MNLAAERLVLDASVAVKWHLADEPATVQALQVLAAYSAGDLALVAPEYICYEVPAALRAATRRKPERLSRQEAEHAVTEFLGFAVPTIADDALITDAWAASYRFACGFYDALYVALALRLGIPLLTADAKLHAHLHRVQTVIWLPDWASAS